MSLLDWFSKKSPEKNAELAQTSGLSSVGATVPMQGAGKPVEQANAVNRRAERLDRREKLYNVVRESMTSAGVLSSSYKFKVLSLDSRGQQYLIMMDLPREHATDTERLTEIEGLIAHNAKSRHEILVTSVYWRINEQVTTGGTRRPQLTPTAPQVTAATTPVPAEPAKPAAESAPHSHGRFDPIQPDEVAAFKKALASAPAGSVQPGETVRSGRRNPQPMPDFQDTVLDDSHKPLSSTQYGDLN